MKVIVLDVFVAAMVKLTQFNVISDPDKVHHRCRAAIQQLTAPVVTSLSICCGFRNRECGAEGVLCGMRIADI